MTAPGAGASMSSRPARFICSSTPSPAMTITHSGEASTMARCLASLSSSSRVTRARSSASQQRPTTRATSSTSSGVQVRAVDWWTAMAAVSLPSL